VKNFASIVVRTLVLLVMAFLAFWLGIAVAMGFDVGMNAPALILAGMYLLTFLPAMVVAFLPLRILLKPGILLKIWYGWMALILVLLALGRIAPRLTGATFQTVARLSHPQDYGELCWRVRGQVPQDGVGFELAEGVIARPQRASKDWQCRYFRIYSQPPEMLFGNGATSDYRSVPIKIERGGHVCVELTRDPTLVSPSDAGWRPERTACEN
jgi:hypothetical protein